MERRIVALFMALLCMTACNDTAHTTPEPLPPEEVNRYADTPSTPELPDSSKPPSVDYTVGAAKLAPLVEAVYKAQYVTGMSLAVFDRNGVIYEQSYGYSSRESGIKADENTHYRIASVSKAVTALLALDLAEQGRLDLDADITMLMGTQVTNPAYPDVKITPRQLMTHTSGIQDNGIYYHAIQSSPISDVTAVLPYSHSLHEPGTRYIYSNLGMGMMSGVIEGATDCRFIDYTREEVFSAMEMDASYSYTDIVDKASVANIYQGGELSADLREWAGMTSKYDKLPVGQLYALGQAELIITAGDLARFAMIMAGCPLEGEVVTLEPDTLRLMQTVQYEQQDTAGYSMNEIKRGLGTQITDRLFEDRRMVGHQGTAYGMVSGLFFDPEAKNGFVLLTNGCGCGCDETGIYTVNRMVAAAVYSTLFA